jgi:hypothetical protein
MPFTLLLGLLLVWFPGTVLPWDGHGHRAISEAVQATLDPGTAKALATIAGTGEELPPGFLARLSMWPDEIRPLIRNPHIIVSGFSPAELLEARAFVQTHPDSKEWHFVDLPLGAQHYPDETHADPADPVLPFTAPNDIVHMIHRCIDILESETDSPEFTKLQALRWLLHLVEDLHQPLHVASGYYRTTTPSLTHPEMITDPVTALQAHARNDRGGNLLLFREEADCPTKPTRENLHSVWDDCLVDMVTGAGRCVLHTTDRQVATLAALLMKQMETQESHAYRSTGDYHQWQEEWAMDSLQVAASRVFTFELVDGCVIPSPKRPHRPLHVQSRILSPPTKDQYLHDHKFDAEVQLTKAAVRLAALLRQIQWK